ncbi:hypothetical protein BASA81_008471 [Batrachochytrium salamandrivorans]|nr:hypothetical protein BASA81_008471 [Batrachochytrium salamandrivorans]
MDRLLEAHGWRYVVLVVCVYGVSQGAGEGLMYFAQQYWLTDTLELSPSKFAEVDAITSIPWQIKSLYGIASDVLPMFGYHRTPYMVGTSLIGLVAFAGLWKMDLALGVGGTTWLLFWANLSIAAPDVMVDASVAQKSSINPALASDLQALCWASFGVFKIASLLVVPTIMQRLGVRVVFGVAMVTSVAVTVPSLLGWMGEERKQDEPSMGLITKLGEFCTNANSGPFVRLSLLLTGMSLAMGVVAMFMPHYAIAAFALLVVTPVIACLVYVYESKVNVTLAKFSLYIFLSGAIQPSSPVLFYWMKQDDFNCALDLPCFSPDFISTISVVGYVTFVVATLTYNRYLTGVSYRKIYAATQFGLFALNLLDLVWVNRWNKTVFAVSDKAFVLGDEVISPMISRWNVMPMLILASQLCPTGVEATFFAMTMGLSNFGGTLGEYFGVGLMEWFGLGAHQYDQLGEFVIARSLCRLLPLLLIPLLLPQGSPDTLAHTAVPPAEEHETIPLQQQVGKYST